MTEKWKSNPMHWCDLCKVWMQDNPNAKQTHERGIKHQEALRMKLRDMRTGAQKRQSEAAKTDLALKALEAQAKHQYEEDLKDAHAVEATTRGRWEEDEGSGHLYNALHRYYYNRENGLYYGGDPPAWTHTPSLPPEARYKEAAKEEPTPPPAAAHSFVRRNGDAGRRTLTIKAHPQAALGGLRMPEQGVVGGLKGVGSLSGPQAGAKRKAEGQGPGRGAPKGKPVSEAEAEALRKREEARKRVEARRLKEYGMVAR